MQFIEKFSLPFRLVALCLMAVVSSTGSLFEARSGHLAAPVISPFLGAAQDQAGANRAVQLDGGTGYVSIATGDTGAITRYWTMEAWVNTTAQSGDLQTILGNGSGSDLTLYDGKVFVAVHNGGFTNFFGTRRFNDGNWHHLAAVRDNDKLYVYIDGQPDIDSQTQQPFKTFANNAAGNVNVRAIGNRGTPSSWFQGLVDDVRLYSRALAVADIAAHYNNGNGIPAATDNGLMLGLHFDEESGVAQDFSGNNRPGTLLGGATRVVRGNAPPPPADTQAPTVTITPLATSITEQATITLTGTAGDNTGVTAVSFQTDRGQQGQATGTADWTANAPLLLGQNVITVRAQDAAGNIGSAQITITRNQPAPPPQINSLTIAAPNQNPAGSATITLGQSVTLAWAIANAQSAALTGASCNVSPLASGSCQHTPAQAGTFTITLAAQANSQTATAAVTLTVNDVGAPSDITPPQLAITAPTQNSFPAGTQQVQIAVTTDEAASCRISPPGVTAGIFVAPTGSPNASGSIAQPIDLATALSANSPARPGDTIWLRGGTYSLPNAVLTGTETPVFRSFLTGAAAAPINVRQYPGERATVDGGIRIDGAYAIYRDFEVFNSTATRTAPRTAGLNVYGPRVKIINLVVHDAGNGIGFWQSAEESEIYGTIIYRNGWEAVNDDRGRGHGIYAQNRDGTKRIVDSLVFDNYFAGLHGYAESGYVSGLHVEGNILFNNGSPARPQADYNRQYNALIGTTTNPSGRITFINNQAYHPLTSTGRNLRFGYTSPSNGDLTVRDNYVAGGGRTLAMVSRWQNATMTGNTFICDDELFSLDASGQSVSGYNWNNNLYLARTNQVPFEYSNNASPASYDFAGWKQVTGLDTNSQWLPTANNRPTGLKVFVRLNQYEPGRANIAVFNWDLASVVAVDASAVLGVGDRYEVRNAQNFFGAPVLTGVYDGNRLSLPMGGTATGPEFNAFVLLTQRRANAQPQPDPPFAAMEPFAQTGGTSHTTNVNTQDGRSYTRIVRCADAAGNVSSAATINFDVLAPPPSPPPQINSFTIAASGQTPGANATITLGQSVTLAWQMANAQSATISGTNCNVAPPSTGNCQHTPPQTGQFTLTLTAQSGLQVATASVTLTVNAPPDTQAPIVTINQPASTTTAQTTITLTGTATDNVGVTALSFFTDRGRQGQPAGINNWTATMPLELGANVIVVQARDAAGNNGSAQIAITRIEPPPPDTTPPQVAVTAPTQSSFPAGTQQVRLGATTNENSSCRYSTDANAAFQAMTAFAQTGALAHSTNIATQNGTSYNLFARCADATGNVSGAQPVSFSVQTPPPPPPSSNKAMQFDGFTGNVAVQTGDTGVLTRFWTIELWLKTDSQRIDYMTLIGNGSGSDVLMTGGLMLISTYNGQFTHFLTRRRLNDNQWHHLAAVRDGDKLIVYIDGQIEFAQSDSAQRGYITVNNPVNVNNLNLRSLGNRGTPSSWYQGLMDDVRVYSRALSAAEVQAHFNNGNGIPASPDSGLFAGFDFNEASGNALDFSGNNRHGTLQGVVTRVAH